MSIQASDPNGPDYEAALAALAVLRDQLSKMAIRDLSRPDAHLGMVFDRYLAMTEGQIMLHQQAGARYAEAAFPTTS